MNLISINIALRAAICFGVITALLIGLGVFSFDQIQSLRAAQQNLEENTLPSVQVINDTQIALLSTRLECLRMLGTSVAEVRSTSITKVKKGIQDLRSLTDFYRNNLISGEKDRIQLDASSKAMATYIDGVNDILSLETSNREKAILTYNNEQVKKADLYQSELSLLKEQNSIAAKQSGIESKNIYENSILILVTVVLIASILTVILAVALTRSIVNPINLSLNLAQDIAAGDLTKKLKVTGSDEAARLMIALNLMQENLRGTIMEISGASTQLSAAAVEMTSITEIADRTLQQQNSEIEQAATAVNEMSAAVEEVAKNATSTSEAAKESSKSAEFGNKKVVETLDAMQSLTNLVGISSNQVQALAGQAQDISKVLSVIRAIAEQTNLLALNAAIEAARAGEQGRGFAVVADEVRALAHRTQVSTQEIEQMISTIQAGSSAAVESMLKSSTEVNSTQKTAEEAGQSLRKITDSVLKINDRNLQIATASEEQAHVARDVDRSLISIRDLAVQSSEGTRQTLIASNELSRLAVSMNNLVLRFKT